MGTLAPSEPMIFYDMATRPPVSLNYCSASPWKSRLALNFKNIPYSASWVPHLKISQHCHPLDVSAGRKFENDSDYYTLPILIDPNTNTRLEDSFEIAIYLQEIYPTAGAGDLFPPQKLDFALNDDLAVFALLSERKETKYQEYSKFNTSVDALFTSHAPLMLYQMPLDLDTADGRKAGLVRRAGISPWVHFEVEGEERAKLKESLWSVLGDLGRLFARDPTGPFILGQQASYADIIVGGWLRMMCMALPSDEWQEVKSWHGGIFGNLHDALEKYAELEVN
ncbi:hypothetical protein N7540_012177 [Penicillium herquei]|nr:hypothetical protein N7540_012177 [Penicillium herquei]